MWRSNDGSSRVPGAPASTHSRHEVKAAVCATPTGLLPPDRQPVLQFMSPLLHLQGRQGAVRECVCVCVCVSECVCAAVCIAVCVCVEETGESESRSDSRATLLCSFSRRTLCLPSARSPGKCRIQRDGPFLSPLLEMASPREEMEALHAVE